MLKNSNRIKKLKNNSMAVITFLSLFSFKCKHIQIRQAQYQRTDVNIQTLDTFPY